MQSPADQMELEEMVPWFLPLHNVTQDHGNMPMLEYFGSNILETAPVSDAARSHIRRLNDTGLEPHEWRDAFSRSVLDVAIVKNYVKLAQWLVDMGVPVKDDNGYR